MRPKAGSVLPSHEEDEREERFPAHGMVPTVLPYLVDVGGMFVEGSRSLAVCVLEAAERVMGLSAVYVDGLTPPPQCTYCRAI